MKISRRIFVQGGLAAFGSSWLVARTPFAAAFSPRRAGGRILPEDNGNRLVVVQLRGGNDGLNTVVPYTDSRYWSLRPALAPPAGDLIPITEELALHPALAPLEELWHAGRLAILENVGYPNPDLSHFRSEAIWYTADPAAASGGGWLGRWTAGRASPSPLALTTIGALPSPATSAPGFVPAAVDDPESFGFDLANVIPEDTALRAALIHDGFAAGAAEPSSADIAAVGLAAEETIAQVGLIPPQDEPPVPYPDSSLAADLATAARFLATPLGTRVVWVSTGGFDNHADEEATHPGLLADVAASVTAFLADLQFRGLADRTAVLVWSEFGRRPAENASLGTDHGTAAPAFLLGPPVRGGLYGVPPDLGTLDGNGNLVFDIDFRAIYETVLAEHLGVDPRLVMPSPFERLGVFR